MARRPIDQRCSFCGKTRDQVRRLVAGPGVFICDDCVRLCNEVINEPPAATPGATGSGTWVKTTSRSRGWFWRLFRPAQLQPGS